MAVIESRFVGTEPRTRLPNRNLVPLQLTIKGIAHDSSWSCQVFDNNVFRVVLFGFGRTTLQDSDDTEPNTFYKWILWHVSYSVIKMAQCIGILDPWCGYNYMN